MANNYRSPTLAVGSKTARQGTSASLNIGDCILVGTPPADGCLSMDLYARDVSEAFGRVFPSLSHILLQPGGETAPWIQKQYLRYSGYPKLLRREIRTRKASVVHVLDHSYAHLCRVAEKTIVTCHDIADLKVSSLTFWQSALWKWRISGLRRAARIVAMSENTARDLRELLEIPPEQIVVNYSGVSGRFTPSQAPPEAECARRTASRSWGKILIPARGKQHYAEEYPPPAPGAFDSEAASSIGDARESRRPPRQWRKCGACRAAESYRQSDRTWKD